jgi:hypothetical protein
MVVLKKKIVLIFILCSDSFFRILSRACQFSRVAPTWIPHYTCCGMCLFQFWRLGINCVSLKQSFADFSVFFLKHISTKHNNYLFFVSLPFQKKKNIKNTQVCLFNILLSKRNKILHFSRENSFIWYFAKLFIRIREINIIDSIFFTFFVRKTKSFFYQKSFLWRDTIKILSSN